jgi:hypothetical protein
MSSRLFDMSKRQWQALISIILSTTIFRVALQLLCPPVANGPLPSERDSPRLQRPSDIHILSFRDMCAPIFEENDSRILYV